MKPDKVIPPPAVLSVFDFDGTLTWHDSFLPFLIFAFGTQTACRHMLKLVLPSLGFVLGRYSRDELKARLVQTFLTGVDAQWLGQTAAQFSQAWWGRLMRPAGLSAVAAEIQSGAVVTLCSASPSLVLRSFADRLGVQLIGTELETVDGLLTGRIVGDNCRGENKVLRLEEVYGPLRQMRLRVWGDSPGDNALLLRAQDPHWRPFHPRWQVW
ncbi:HAD-IB family phosphatase [Pseudomonas sp. MDT1-17]